MNIRLHKRFAVVTTILVTTLAAHPSGAHADPQSVPNGPWVQDRQNVSLSRLHTNEELAEALRRIAQASQGRITVSTIGHSNEGRPLFLAKVGTGPLHMLYIAQQHGNEPLGAEAALQLLERVGKPGSGWADVLSRVTLLVVPRVNPDGAHRFWRENFDPDCSGAFCTRGRGFDINRWHDPAVAPEANPVPEAAAVQRVYAQYRPAMVVDYHHQGSFVTDDGEAIRASIFWPNAAGVPASALTLSRQMCVLIYDTLGHYGFGVVSQYPGTLPNGIARNGYGLLGSGSVLVEMRGGIGQKSSGQLMRLAYTVMAALLEAAAEGTVSTMDPARADQIPLRGESIDNPHDDE